MLIILDMREYRIGCKADFREWSTGELADVCTTTWANSPRLKANRTARSSVSHHISDNTLQLANRNIDHIRGKRRR